MYTDFASVYDRLMDDFDYPVWAAYYRELLMRAGCDAKNVAECGCGTGNMTLAFARFGWRITAGDLSGEMLEVASAKARAAGVRVPFIQQDMRSLRLPRPADAVLCCCDGVNYLLRDEDARAFFTSARDSLVPGGCLAFDVSSRAKLAGLLNNNLFSEDRGDLIYVWRNEWRADRQLCVMNLTFFAREPSGLYRRFDETQIQRAYDEDTLRALLVSAGFTDIRVYGDKTFDPPADSDMRLHVTARRA